MPSTPTPDKPGISVVNCEPGNSTFIFLNLAVADIHACYEKWKALGAEFVTPPIDRGPEVRCYMRDPDGYLIEVRQATGLLAGKTAKKPSRDGARVTSRDFVKSPSQQGPSRFARPRCEQALTRVVMRSLCLTAERPN